MFPSITLAWTWAPHSVLLKSLRKVPVTLPKTWCQLRAAGVLGERKCDCLKSPARAGRRRLPRRVRLESGSAFLSSSSGGGRRAQTDGVSRGKNVENGAFVTFLPSQVNGKRSLSEIRFAVLFSWDCFLVIFLVCFSRAPDATAELGFYVQEETKANVSHLTPPPSCLLRPSAPARGAPAEV